MVAFLSPVSARRLSIARPSIPITRAQCNRFRHKHSPTAIALSPALTLLTLTAVSTHRAIPNTLRGPPIAFLASSLLTNLSLLPTEAPIYITMIDIAPAAVCLLLLQPRISQTAKLSATDMRHILVAFVVGAIGTTLGAILAALLGILPAGLCWQVAAAFAATYIGGSVNYIGVVNALNIPSEIAAAGLAADLALMALYFGGLFALAARQREQREAEVEVSVPKKEADSYTQSNWVVLLLLPIALTVSLVAASRAVVSALHLPPGFDLLLMAFGSILLSGIPQLEERLMLSGKVGNLAVTAFFAALGATTRISAMLGASQAVIIMAGVVLVVHAMVMYVIGKCVLRIPIKFILIASNANVGGASTAAAFAAALGWRMLIPGAVAVGTLGYLIGTPVALIIFGVARKLTSTAFS